MAYVYERPRWARRDLTLQLTGISENRLIGLVNEGHVRARKMDGKPKSGCVFCVPDVEEWLEKEAPKAGPFKLAGEKEGQSRVG